MSKQATPEQTAPISTEPLHGGRACPLPASPAVPTLRGISARRSARATASTGVITADVVERTFN